MANPLANLFGGNNGTPFNNANTMLSVGLGLLSGKTGNEQFAKAASNFVNERQAGRDYNRTIEYLRQKNPELAQAVESGALSPAEAFKTQLSAKPKSLSFQTLPDGTYGSWDGETGEFTSMGKAEKPVTLPSEAQEYEYARNNGFTGSFMDYKTQAGTKTNDAQQEFETRKRIAEQSGLTPDDPGYQGYVMTGKMPREDAQPLTATDKKALWSAEDEIPMLDNTISSLERAKQLNRDTFTGVTAGTRGWLGTAVPGGDYLVDGDSAKATAEFNKLMSMEAIQSMAQTLKGATTDAELARFVDILADPSTAPDIRERTIDRMTQLAQRVKEVKSARVNELRGGGIKTTPPQGTGTTKSGISFTVEP